MLAQPQLLLATVSFFVSKSLSGVDLGGNGAAIAPAFFAVAGWLSATVAPLLSAPLHGYMYSVVVLSTEAD